MTRESLPACLTIVLIGARASGKTTVGRLLAQALHRDFLDTDSLVEKLAGRTIADIFASDGEAAFRKLESDAVRQALADSRRVIALGGGAVLLPHNRELLRLAHCVWLTADPEELQRRVMADPAGPAARPALTARNGLEEMRQVLAQRRPLYEALARQVVDTDGRTPSAVAQVILTRLQSAPAATEG